MYQIQLEDIVGRKFRYLWSLLAFQAGFLNSIGFLACQRFVSHVTGFGTQSGIAAAHGDWGLALIALTAPASFLYGAWLAGMLTEVRQTRGLTPRYHGVVYVISILIGILFVMGVTGFFGAFGEPLLHFHDYFFLSVLSFICGLQNACFTRMTNGQIRTTHLTGLATDFGTDMALLQRGVLNEKDRLMARRRNLTRAATFVSFVMGAMLSAGTDHILKFWALAVPFGTSLSVSALFFVTKRRLTRNLRPPLPFAFRRPSGATT